MKGEVGGWSCVRWQLGEACDAMRCDGCGAMQCNDLGIRMIPWGTKRTVNILFGFGYGLDLCLCKMG